MRRSRATEPVVSALVILLVALLLMLARATAHGSPNVTSAPAGVGTTSCNPTHASQAVYRVALGGEVLP